MSLPDKYSERVPNSSSCSFESYFAYHWNIKAQVFESGSSNLTVKSSLEIKAGSRSFFQFVAQTTNTSPSDSNESIFLSKVERILHVAS